MSPILKLSDHAVNGVALDACGAIGKRDKLQFVTLFIALAIVSMDRALNSMVEGIVLIASVLCIAAV